VKERKTKQKISGITEDEKSNGGKERRKKKDGGINPPLHKQETGGKNC
jgi:hypothetical protein